MRGVPCSYRVDPVCGLRMEKDATDRMSAATAPAFAAAIGAPVRYATASS
jgi:hypothetical protein